MKLVFSPDVILCGWLGSKHQLTHSLTQWLSVSQQKQLDTGLFVLHFDRTNVPVGVITIRLSGIWSVCDWGLPGMCKCRFWVVTVFFVLHWLQKACRVQTRAFYLSESLSSVLSCCCFCFSVCLLVVFFFFNLFLLLQACYIRWAQDSLLVVCQTHDRKIVGLNTSRSSRSIFFSRVNFLCWLLFSVRSNQCYHSGT